MYYCEKCGNGDCCDRHDIQGAPVLCDKCYITALQAENAKLRAKYDTPFKVGERVYYYNKYARKRRNRIKEYTIQSVEFYKGGYMFHLATTITVFHDTAHSTLFLTREAAETALEEHRVGSANSWKGETEK